MNLKTVSGYINYTSKKPELMDKVRGGERFTITAHEDNTFVMRSQGLISEDSPTVVRDVTQTYDKNWQPKESFVKITVDNKQVGSALYIFGENEVTCTGHNFENGHYQFRNTTPEPTRAFVNHAMQGDAILCKLYDFDKGGRQEIHPFFTTSFHHRGADGPVLKTRRLGLLISFVGKETVTVASGTYETLRFRIGPGTDETYMGKDIHPPYDMWVTDDDFYVLVKASVRGYMQTHYELTEFSKRDGF